MCQVSCTLALLYIKNLPNLIQLSKFQSAELVSTGNLAKRYVINLNLCRIDMTLQHSSGIVMFGAPIRQVSECKYLGVILSKSVNHTADIVRISNIFESPLCAMLARFDYVRRNELRRH